MPHRADGVLPCSRLRSALTRCVKSPLDTAASRLEAALPVTRALGQVAGATLYGRLILKVLSLGHLRQQWR